ncbi:PKD domain protein [anaerobic digester metagenome]
MTAANGCTDTEFITINQNITPPVAVIETPTSTVLTCSVTSITLTASGGVSYSWSDGINVVGTSATLNVTQPGTYTVTVTADNGCTSASSIEINQDDDAPTVSITNNTGTNVLTCTTTSINLTAAGGVSYSWSDGTNVVGTSATLNVTQPGTYTVIVTAANGCTDTEFITINQNITPPVAVIETPATTVLTCTVTSITLTATGGGSYSWSDGTNVVGTSATLNVTQPGTYTVTVTADNGCTSASSIEINQDDDAPTVSITNNTGTNVLTCTTTSINLTAAGGVSYSWSDGTNVVGTSATLNVTQPGTYTVTVTAANGCSDTESITITQNITPPSVEIADQTNVLCFGEATGSATATVTGGTSPYTYLWDDPAAQTTATANGLAAGTYAVTVTDENGCTATAQVVITQPSAVTLLSATAVNPVNWGDNGTITILATGGTGTLHYTIGSETNTTGVFLRPSGNWEYRVTDDNACGPLVGVVTVGDPDTRQLNIKLYLEGFYTKATNTMVSPLGEGPGGNCDYITVKLHNANDYSIVEYTAANVFIKRDGTISITLPSSLNGNYYLSIVHRNSLKTVSGFPVPFVGEIVSYDFSDNASKAYGNKMIEVNSGIWAIYAGDVDQNGIIDTNDMTPVDNDSAGFNTGYLTTDINGDGIVDTADMTFVDNNSASFVTSSTP